MNKKLIAVFLLGCATKPMAAEVDLELGLQGMRDSNALLTADNEESDLEQGLLARVALLQQGSRMTADLDYDVRYLDYAENTQESSTEANGSAAVKLELAERLLDWHISNQMSNALTDSQSTDTAANRENRSVTSTRLDFRLAPGKVDEILLSPSFADVRFEESEESDSVRPQLGARWLHRMSAVSAIQLDGLFSQVEFEDEANDYDYQSLSVGYQSDLAKLSYQINVGSNEVEPKAGEALDGTLFNAEINYATDTASFGASAAQELTDSSIGFSLLELDFQDFESGDRNFGELDIVERQQFQIFMDKSFGASTRLALRGGYTDEDFQAAPDDQTSNTIDASLDRSLTEQLSIRLALRYENIEFIDDPSDLEYDDSRVEVSFDYRVLRDLTLRLGAGHEERDASQDFLSYDNEFVFLLLNYKAL